MPSIALVHIVDDDLSARDALASLFDTVGLNTQSHASADSFFEAFDSAVPGCVVTDVCMPGMSGLTLQQKLADGGHSIPVIILTGYADVAMAVEAMAGGAVGFFQKPPRWHELLDLATSSVAWHCRQMEQSSSLAGIRERFQLLTEREREILQSVVEGTPSKDIAVRCKISQRTVEQHRAHLMQKLQVNSLAQLVRVAVAVDDSRQRDRLRDSLSRQSSRQHVA